MFYDVHTHAAASHSGGILIGLEGQPHYPGVVSNAQALAAECRSQMLFAALYVEYANTTIEHHDLLKYHPKREGYTPEWVTNDIRQRGPRLVVIDTLNQPYWQPLDYWRIALAFPEIQFLWAHGGGYDVLDFLKIASFTKNSWIDFSLTQEWFGWVGKRARLPHVCDCIDYAFRDDRLKRKTLFGSDLPFFSQELAWRRTQELHQSNLFLVENFLSLIQAAGLT